MPAPSLAPHRSLPAVPSVAVARSGRRRLGAALAVALALGISPVGPARAQGTAPAPIGDAERQAARQMARDAAELIEQRRFVEAEDLLRRASAIVDAPTVALLHGRALEGAGRWIEALERFEYAARFPSEPGEPEAFTRARAEAVEAAKSLAVRMPQITPLVHGIDPATPSLRIRIDDREIPQALIGVRQPLDPGEHLVTASLGDTVHDTRAIAIGPGDEMKVLLRVELSGAPPPPPPPAPAEEPARESPAGWIALGVGGVGLAVGMAGTFLMASEVGDQCDSGCSTSDLDTFRVYRAVALGGYVVAVGGGVTSAIILGRQARARREAAAGSRGLTLWGAAGPQGVSLGGTFR